MINFLIKHGLNVNECNKKGETPLWNACQFGNIENAKTLIEAGANIKTDPSPLEAAIAAGHHEIVKYLVSKLFN